MTHTRDEIMQMSADELRIKIAKKQGWTNITDSGCCGSIGRYAFENIPDYPHDIAAAWELVEETNRRCWTVNVQREAEGATVFVTERGAVTHEPKKIWEFGDTAPLAISRAWLIWSEESGK